MREKHLLPKVSKYFKTNLHTHSTISDGTLSPEGLKKAYKDKGFQILAITDHNVIADHSALNDPDFLMLTAAEVDYSVESGWYDTPTYHLNLIAKRADNLWLPGLPKNHSFNERNKDLIAKMHFEGVKYEYSPESINALIARSNEMGFLVSYNHPTWSCQSYPDYAPLKGLWGMELRNSISVECGNNDNHNARVFKDLLNLGNNVYPIGADDTHGSVTLGFSWIMVGAEKLSYDSVIEALEKGDFYMSCGPEIFDLTMYGSTLKISCSDARRVSVECRGRFADTVSAKDDKWLNKAAFDLSGFIERANGNNEEYIYLTITAPDGSYAATRAYYLNELI